MRQVNIAEAKATLSELVARALAGEEIVIARDNKPLVRLAPLAANASKRRVPGSARGQIKMSADYGQPLAEFDDYR